MYLSLKAAILLATLSSVQLTEAFRKVTAQEAWKELNPGWNLGNTLDAVPDEGSWNNPKVSEYTFDDIKKAKFNSVRIPVTWTDHFASQAPNYTVNAAWLNRVEQVVDWSLKRGFWTVLNVHHDSWQWADFTIDPDTHDERLKKFEKLWIQIADRFKNKSEKLILEPLNEPAGGSSQENAERYNVANQKFVDIVRNSGGYNKDRLLTIPGLNTNIQRTVDWFKEPVGVGNYILHVHDYDPWAFVSTSWGRTFWGSDADKKEIEDTFIALQNRFKAPALVGEWGVTGKSIEPGASWRYFDFLSRTTTKYQLAAQLWDNGDDHFDRINRKWRDPVKLAIIQNAVKGIPNSLVTYNQEPVLYFPPGAVPAVEKKILIDWNGNTLKDVRLGSETGKQLKKGRDYSATTDGVIFTGTYLSSLISTYAAGELGTLTQLWIIPSKGAAFPIDIKRTTLPTVSADYFNITDASTTFVIPITSWGGTKLATVKAVKRDGTYLKDDWTQWLGPLEQARLNWGDFDAVDGGVAVYNAVLGLAKSAGQEVDLTLEYWPRVEGNSQTVTLNYVGN